MDACSDYLIKDPETMKGHWRDLMPQCRELRVEVGCGKGKFTVETAAAEPDILLIAVEVVDDAMVVGMEKAKEMGLSNVFFVSMDVARLETFFEESELDLLYINFCDPWPRSKNAKRRLTYHTFLDKYRYVLKLGGEIHFKTDNAKLFEFSLEEFAYCDLEMRNVTRDLHANGPVGIMTGYEEKFYQLGTPINRCECIVRSKPVRTMDVIAFVCPVSEENWSEPVRNAYVFDAENNKILPLQGGSDLIAAFCDAYIEQCEMRVLAVQADAASAEAVLASAVKKAKREYEIGNVYLVCAENAETEAIPGCEKVVLSHDMEGKSEAIAGKTAGGALGKQRKNA